jgi:cell division septation protein DedD
MDLFDTSFSGINPVDDPRGKAKRRRSAQRSISEGEIGSAKISGRKRKVVRDERPSGKRPKRDADAVKPKEKKIKFQEQSTDRSNNLKVVLLFVLLAVLAVILVNYYDILDSSNPTVPLRTIRKKIIRPPAMEKLPAEMEEEAAHFTEIFMARETSTEKPEYQKKTSMPVTQIEPNENTYTRELVPMENVKSYPYSIYFGSYNTLDRAKKAVSTYEEKGLSPYWVKVDLGTKGIWYRIFSGYFSDGKQALAFINSKKLTEASVQKTKYSALIGVYSSKEEIQEKSLALSGLGYFPYVIPGIEEQSELHSGAFDTKASAKQHRAELASKGIQSRIVER